jgi:hypothetical protein
VLDAKVMMAVQSCLVVGAAEYLLVPGRRMGWGGVVERHGIHRGTDRRLAQRFRRFMGTGEQRHGAGARLGRFDDERFDLLAEGPVDDQGRILV